ncbi:SDR family oxidoreductase [Streptomyces sp. 8N114]|uniref:SDR family oxidoreductase n=1 Tax=Streptomyces sp. 8N114 TaxID=3457419 RepID=UPI003FD0B6A0
MELAPYNIRVNAVAPGTTRTPLYEATAQLPQGPTSRRPHSGNSIPLGWPATPQNVANAIAFLASSNADYITGITLPIDGGYTVQ